MLDENFWQKYFIYYDYLNVLIPYQDLLRKFEESFENVEGSKILDAGAGTGNLSVRLSKKGAKVYGLDYSKSGLEIIKKKDATINTILHNLVKKLPFQDNFFDIVVSNNTLYTFPQDDIESILKEFHRVLKPGGFLVMSNLKKGFNPLKIYLSHIKSSFIRYGSLRATLQIITLIIPTLKIFYYNYLISKEEKNQYNFFDFGEQKELLEKSGFIKASEEESVYSNQAYFLKATKG